MLQTKVIIGNIKRCLYNYIIWENEMKIRTYTKEQLEYFPLYTCTVDINHLQEKVNRPNGYEFNQLFIVSGGSAVLKINGECHTVSTNDLFYIAKNVPHEYYGKEGDFKTSFLSFCDNGFDNIKKYYNVSDFGIYKNKNNGVFESCLTKLFDSFEDAHETSTLCTMTFSAVIAFFDEACKKEYSPIESVYNYIENSYFKMITLEDILKFYPYSKSKLCHDFKQKYKMSVFDMLTKIRLKNAHYMIKSNPHIKLSEIAHSCGFNDVSYFCKMYKRRYNCSPKETLS